LRRLIILAAATLIVSAGCAEGTGGSTAEPPIVEVSVTDVGALTFPLDPYRDVGGVEDAVNEAHRILFAECMARFGFTVDPPSPGPSQAELRSRRYGLADPELARQYGYHNPLADEMSRSQPGEPPSDAYIAVATGNGPATYQGIEIPEGGCSGEADRILDEGAPAVEFELLGQALATEAGTRAERDSRVLAAFEAWSECMARSGYEYADPWQANNDPAFATPEPTPAEIAVATADVACKQEVNLINIWAGVEMAYQEQLMEENAAALAELLELLETRRRNAAQIVAQHS
jgi:hypothetical protein